MKLYTYFLFIFYLTYSSQSSTLFSIQDTLTVFCKQFPLVSTINDSSLQCARLRTDENFPTSTFDLDTPTQIILFIIIDPPLATKSPFDISLNFAQSLDMPSSISEMQFSLLVARSNFTVNNDTTMIYTPSDILIFRWQNTTAFTYELIDIIQLENQLYEADTSLCKWDSNQWNRLFNTNMSNNVSYVYFLKTTNLQLNFTLVNTSNETSSLLPPPVPYLNILYCVPYKLGVTEIVLIVCFGVLFLLSVILLSIFHYFKGGPDNRTRHFEGYHHRHGPSNSIKDPPIQVRRRSSVSVVSSDEHQTKTKY